MNFNRQTQLAIQHNISFHWLLTFTYLSNLFCSVAGLTALAKNSFDATVSQLWFLRLYRLLVDIKIKWKQGGITSQQDTMHHFNPQISTPAKVAFEKAVQELTSNTESYMKAKLCLFCDCHLPPDEKRVISIDKLKKAKVKLFWRELLEFPCTYVNTTLCQTVQT